MDSKVIRNVFLVFFVFIGVVNSSFGSVQVKSKVESVVLYHSGALVKRTSSIDLPVGVSELIFKNISSKLILNSLRVDNGNITILNKQIITKVSNEEFSALFDKKEAIEKQLGLIEEKYVEVGFVKTVEDLEKLTSFYSTRILKLKQELREVKREITAAEKIKSIQLDNEDAAILKLIVSAQSRLESPLSLQYVCGGIGWSPYYEVSVENSSDKEIEINYLARTMSQTGENWDAVALYLSSSFPLSEPTKLPVLENPWLLKSRSRSRSFYSPTNQIAKKDHSLQLLEGVEYHDINVPSNLRLVRIAGLNSIKSNSTVFTFPVKKANLVANYYYYGFPGLDPEVYLVAEVQGWDTLGFVDGIAEVSFGGNSVSETIIKFSDFKNKLTLPVGKDNSVFMKRTEMQDQKYFKVSNSGKKKTSTYAYQLELKNNNTFPVQFRLFDQVPLSQTKQASVEVLKDSQGQISLETGEVTWDISVKPGEEIEKQLIFTIEMESKYRFVPVRKKKKFTPVSSPSF